MRERDIGSDNQFGRLNRRNDFGRSPCDTEINLNDLYKLVNKKDLECPSGFNNARMLSSLGTRRP